MGVALADEAHRRGARVTLLAANVSAPLPAGVEVVATPTAADLEREALFARGADVILMAAAVGDYRAAAPVDGKRPKDGAAWQVELTPTTDIARSLGERRTPARFLSPSEPSTAPQGSSASGGC